MRFAIKRVNKLNKQFKNYDYFFYIYVYLIKIHLKFRVAPFYKYIPLKKSPQISLCIIYIICIFNFFKSSKELLYNYNLKKSPNIKKNIAIKFPQHSYSISNNKNISSFGEYLNKKNTINIVSLDEYLRPSFLAGEKLCNSHSINRNILHKKIHLNNLFFSFKNLLKIFSSYKKIGNPILISLVYFSDLFKQIKYMNFIRNLESNNELDTVYVLPFDNHFHLYQDESVKNKILVFNYAENFFLPPAPTAYSYIGNKFDLLNVINSFTINAFQYYGSPVGFTNVVSCLNNVKRHLNFFLYANFEISNLVEEDKPCFLGYESHTFNVDSKYIVVFDIPPESKNSQMANYLIGDPVAGIDFNKNFLLDIAQVGLSMGVSVVIKPKYSLKNYGDDYKLFLLHLIDRFGVIILDPYVRSASVIEASVGVISAPYTSTNSFAKILNKNSCYYVPHKYNKYDEFFSEDIKSKVISGKLNLFNFLTK